MPKSREKSKRLTEDDILHFLESSSEEEEDGSDDDNLPSVEVDDDFVPDPPYTHEEEVIIEHAVCEPLVFSGF